MAKETFRMSNDLDELMARDPLTLSAQDIDAIIDYHRKQRARRASGEKPTKPTASAGIDISSITQKLVKAAKPAGNFVRRV
jgi:hypothetical protein